MQATLLAVGITIILALVAALAGPHFVDWSQYRSVFEAEASRLAGVPVRVTGAIDVRILPTPSLMLRGIEAGPGGEGLVTARELAIELRLGPLLKGQLRAAEMRLVGPQIKLGIDAGGRIDWPVATGGIDVDKLSIDGLAIEDGRAVLSDAAAGASIVLDKLWFNGEVRSLVGPVKGEGGFQIGDERYGYRLSAGRLAEDASMRLRLAIDPSDRPLTIEADGLIRLERGAPRFEGALTLARPPSVLAATGRASSVPWRVVGKVKASPANALLEQVELQYGPDERAIKLTGVADIRFGKKPRFDAVLSARQIDLDAVLDLPEPARHLPLAAIRSLAEDFAGALDLPIPGNLGIGIDTVILAGSQVQAVRGDFRADATGWDLDTFEFRAPGFAQARLSGRLGFAPHGVTFSGPAAIEASDPKTLVDWLEGRTEPGRRQFGSLRISGNLTADAGRIAIEKLKAEADRQTVEGRLAYAFAAADRPARLEAELKAADLDVDAAIALAQAAASGSRIGLPGELTLAVDIGAATIAGVAAKSITIKLTSDASGLALEKLSVGDLGGAAFELGGRIEAPWTAPHGMLTLDVDARGFDGTLALLARLAPQSAESIRPMLAHLLPLKTRAVLRVDAPAAATAGVSKLTIEGNVGTVRVALTADGTGDPRSPASLGLVVNGQAVAEDGRALLALLGLDRAVVVDRTRATLGFSVRGAPADDLRVEARLAAGGFSATANGTLGLAGDRGVTAGLDLAVTAADASPLRRDPAAPPARALPVTLKTRFTAAGDTLALDNLAATIAGTPVRGRIGVVLGASPRLDGRLDADAVDAAAVIATVIGMPARRAGEAADWSSDQFTAGWLDGLTGRLEFSIPRAALTPTLVARSVRGVLRFGDGVVVLEDVEAQLAAGHARGELTFSRVANTLAAHLRLSLTDADATAIIRAGARPPVVGRVSLQVEADGSGLSPVTLMGSLKGSGVVTLDGGQFAGLDPKVFEAVTRAVDKGLAIDPGKIKDVVATALDRGDLRVARLDGALVITSGQMRLANVIARGDGADLMISGTIDLADALLDARLIFSGRADRDTGAGRPDVFVALKGPIAAPKRTIDVSALAGWLMLRAVDRETRRIEAIEAERRESALSSIGPPASPSAAAPPIAAPPTAPAPQATAPATAPTATAPAAPAPTTAPVATAPVPPTKEPETPPSTPVNAPSPAQPTVTAPQPPAHPRTPRRVRPEASTVPGEQAPPLPPPIDIRPSPGPGKPPHATRNNTPSARPAPSPPLPVPERPQSRNWFDPLFGAQR